MLSLPTGRRRKWYIGMSVATAIAVAASVGTWRIIESRESQERAELAAELRGEGVPAALARHHRVAVAILGSRPGAMSGRMSPLRSSSFTAANPPSSAAAPQPATSNSTASKAYTDQEPSLS